MPYRPGVTLEQMMRRIGRGKPPRTARAISEALRPSPGQAEHPPDQQTEGWKEFPVHKTFPEAVAWIGLVLANALFYLHQRGVFHRDIKPANILLAHREGPQLLDFNLAQDPSNAQGASAAQKGGTLPYMAPEQLKAFLDPTAWDDVGASADLYSLGLVLRELLTGRPPEWPTSQGSLAREIQSLIDRRLAPTASISDINPGVPPALESIVEKCLAVRPEHRYAAACDLAADLRRFLDRKPLVVAPNRSRFELGVNWIYRHHKSVAWAMAISTLLALVALTTTFVQRGVLLNWRFREAYQLLDSGTPENLRLAGEKFKSLHDEHPETARSSLGLGWTIAKLAPRKSSRASLQIENKAKRLFDAAASADDAEPVIRARLEGHPEVPLLHRTLGLALWKDKKIDQARASFDRSIQLDPTGYSSYIYLAMIDEAQGRFLEAADHIEQALQFCEYPEVVHAYRKSLLRLLTKLIDDQLERNRGQAAAYRPRFESQFRLFQDDGKATSDRGEIGGDALAVAYYGGCLASIRGALEHDPKLAAGSFDEADRLFDEAEKAAPDPPVDYEASRIKEQRLNLERRRSANSRAATGSTH